MRSKMPESLTRCLNCDAEAEGKEMMTASGLSSRCHKYVSGGKPTHTKMDEQLFVSITLKPLTGVGPFDNVLETMIGLLIES